MAVGGGSLERWRGEFGVRGDVAVTGGELVIIIHGRAEVTFNKCGAAGLSVWAFSSSYSLHHSQIGKLMRFPGNTPTFMLSLV